MMKIRLLFASLIISCLFFVANSVLAGSVAAAPRLFFDPASTNAAKGTDLPINLQIDVENKSAFGADATITFPTNDFSIKSVTNGGFFSDFSYALSDGKIEIHGYFSALYGSKSGNGTFAVITLNSNRDSGTGSLKFTCSTSDGETEILDSNGQNILTCSSLNQEDLNYVASPPGNGPTNACQGTCGSNYNCDNGLFCLNGFCRNPDCRDDNTCGCKQTPTPTPTIKPTVKPTVKPTSKPIVLSKFTPLAAATPEVTVTPEPTTTQKFDYINLGIWAAIILLGLILLFALLKLFKGEDNDNPPKITPPSQEPIEPVQPAEPIQTYHVAPPVQDTNPLQTPQDTGSPQTPTV